MGEYKGRLRLIALETHGSISVAWITSMIRSGNYEGCGIPISTRIEDDLWLRRGRPCNVYYIPWTAAVVDALWDARGGHKPGSAPICDASRGVDGIREWRSAGEYRCADIVEHQTGRGNEAERLRQRHVEQQSSAVQLSVGGLQLLRGRMLVDRGAVNQNYYPATSDEGHTLRVQVSATNSGGSVAAVSAATSLVATGTPNNPLPEPPSVGTSSRCGPSIIRRL